VTVLEFRRVLFRSRVAGPSVRKAIEVENATERENQYKKPSGCREQNGGRDIMRCHDFIASALKFALPQQIPVGHGPCSCQYGTLLPRAETANQRKEMIVSFRAMMRARLV